MIVDFYFLGRHDGSKQKEPVFESLVLHHFLETQQYGTHRGVFRAHFVVVVVVSVVFGSVIESKDLVESLGILGKVVGPAQTTKKKFGCCKNLENLLVVVTVAIFVFDVGGFDGVLHDAEPFTNVNHRIFVSHVALDIVVGGVGVEGDLSVGVFDAFRVGDSVSPLVVVVVQKGRCAPSVDLESKILDLFVFGSRPVVVLVGIVTIIAWIALPSRGCKAFV
mmetsp:Transcript_11932/g.25230  ORF Transcript_11932/g.25230 Transcript_11932/m.25230 type:complete len:221 (-) Transcript_11932:36-698(-)